MSVLMLAQMWIRARTGPPKSRCRSPLNSCHIVRIFGCFEHQLGSCFYVLLVILRQKDFYWYLGDILASRILYP